MLIIFNAPQKLKFKIKDFFAILVLIWYNSKALELENDCSSFGIRV